MTRLQQGLLAAVGVILLIVASLHYVIVRVEQRGPRRQVDLDPGPP